MDIPSNLIKSLARQECVIAIGAGFSYSAEKLPLWDKLIKSLAYEILKIIGFRLNPIAFNLLC